MSDTNNPIHPEMTVLDVVSRCRETEGVFKRYDARVGECICCQERNSFFPVGVRENIRFEGRLSWVFRLERRKLCPSSLLKRA